MSAPAAPRGAIAEARVWRGGGESEHTCRIQGIIALHSSYQIYSKWEFKASRVLQNLSLYFYIAKEYDQRFCPSNMFSKKVVEKGNDFTLFFPSQCVSFYPKLVGSTSNLRTCIDSSIFFKTAPRRRRPRENRGFLELCRIWRTYQNRH